VGKIAGFGLLSNHRNKGIGSTLMRRALDHFQTKGVKQALITVNGENPKAMKLYQKFGFKVVEDSTKNYYRIK
jgi:ribosomal protein S18 acetylase RimI-like enzyme